MNIKYNPLTWFVRQKLWQVGLDICSYPNMPQLLSECDLVIDAGANEGCIYKFIRSFGYRGNIVSIEANPSTYAKMLQKSGYNWLRENLCLSDKQEMLTFYQRGGDGSFDGVHTQAGDKDGIKVSAIRLDSLTFPKAENIFLKIDCEGHDLAVMRGASGLFKRTRYVMMEVPVCPRYEEHQTFSQAITAMSQLGFEVSNFIGNIFHADRIKSQAFDMIFQNVASQENKNAEA